MDQGRVSVSYARALLDWASSKNLLDEVYAQTKRFLQFLAQNPNFSEFLSSPGISMSRKQEVIETLLVDFAPHLSKLVFLAIRNKRERQLPSILLMFQKLYRDKVGIALVVIESACQLGSDTIDGIGSYLGKKLSKKIEVEQRVNQTLIGGFTLTIEDKFMDKSVKGELELFRKKLLGIV